jgi:hypothetical protein
MTFPKGRIAELDPASRLPRFAAQLAPDLVTKLWPHEGPITYQKIGSCTGHSTATLLNSEWAQNILFGATRRWFTERDGDRLYSAATRRDGVPGVWPPDDTGSSGLGVMKALMKDILLDGKPIATGYDWAFGAGGLARRMPKSPALIGIPWPESMDTPDSSGHLRHDPRRDAPPEEGHEIGVYGYDAPGDYFTVINTWEGWGGVGRERGNPGRARIDRTLMGWLLAQQGDVKIPRLRILA